MSNWMFEKWKEYCLLEEAKAREKTVDEDNVWHNSDGEWDSEGNATSWSHRGKQKRHPSGANAKPCGRQAPVKCKDGTSRYSEELESDDCEIIDEDSMLLTTPDDNERERKSKIFPAYKEMKRLSLGITEFLDQKLSETRGDSICFSRDELKRYRANLFKQFLNGIAAYEKASKGGK